MKSWDIYRESDWDTSGGLTVRPPAGRRFGWRFTNPNSHPIRPRRFRAPHPPLIGRQEAVLAGAPPPSRDKNARREWLTKTSAYYPAELTWQLLGSLAVEHACRKMKTDSVSAPQGV